MPRKPRVVVPGYPHHVTQRGNNQQDVFLTEKHFRKYMSWLEEHCEAFQVALLAYCLMSNHVHFIAVPLREDSLSSLMKVLHNRYAQWFNLESDRSGHLWQGRYFSCAMDEDYTLSAIRYVERNPVTAGLVEVAQEYAWSSAAAHCGVRQDALLTADIKPWQRIGGIKDWSKWLQTPEENHRITALRKAGKRGIPCGEGSFLEELESKTGKLLRTRPRGRPKKGVRHLF